MIGFELLPIYKGEAGPTEQQIKEYTDILEFLLMNNCSYKYRRYKNKNLVGYIDDILQVKRRKVVYDRWGFCSCDGIGGLEQGDYKHTLQYLLKGKLT